jgi:hypothetical protein
MNWFPPAPQREHIFENLFDNDVSGPYEQGHNQRLFLHKIIHHPTCNDSRITDQIFLLRHNGTEIVIPEDEWRDSLSLTTMQKIIKILRRFRYEFELVIMKLQNAIMLIEYEQQQQRLKRLYNLNN